MSLSDRPGRSVERLTAACAVVALLISGWQAVLTRQALLDATKSSKETSQLASSAISTFEDYSKSSKVLADDARRITNEAITVLRSQTDLQSQQARLQSEQARLQGLDVQDRVQPIVAVAPGDYLIGLNEAWPAVYGREMSVDLLRNYPVATYTNFLPVKNYGSGTATGVRAQWKTQQASEKEPFVGIGECSSLEMLMPGALAPLDTTRINRLPRCIRLIEVADPEWTISGTLQIFCKDVHRTDWETEATFWITAFDTSPIRHVRIQIQDFRLLNGCPDCEKVQQQATNILEPTPAVPESASERPQTVDPGPSLD